MSDSAVTVLGIPLSAGDAIALGSCVVAVASAVFSKLQASFAKIQAQAAQDQVRASVQANTQAIQRAAEDDVLRRKQKSSELAIAWCTIESRSPLTKVRDWLASVDQEAIDAILDGREFDVDKSTYGESIVDFLAEASGNQGIRGALQPDRLRVSPELSRVLRRYFVLRINFFEMVTSLVQEKIADESMTESFFGDMIRSNPSYRRACRSRSSGQSWPYLKRFFGIKD